MSRIESLSDVPAWYTKISVASVTFVLEINKSPPPMIEEPHEPKVYPPTMGFPSVLSTISDLG